MSTTITPERDNSARADAAEAALAAYTATNTDAYALEHSYERIADLMCDLLHLAAREHTPGVHDGEDKQFDFIKLLWRARMNFEEECEAFFCDICQSNHPEEDPCENTPALREYTRAHDKARARRGVPRP